MNWRTPNVLPRDHTREDYDFEYADGAMAPIRVGDTVWCIRHGWEREIVPSSWLHKDYDSTWWWTCPACGESRNRMIRISKQFNRIIYSRRMALKSVWSHINAKHDGIVPHRRKRWSSDDLEDPRLFYS